MSGDGFIGASLNLGFLDRIRSTLARPDLRPAWKEVKKPLRADLKDHKKRRESPEGSWAPIASSTKARRLAGRNKRSRRLLGRLPSAIKLSYDRRRLIAGSIVKRWPQVHQWGGRAGHGARIPQRQFLWVSDKLTEAAAAIIAKVLAKAGFG